MLTQRTLPREYLPLSRVSSGRAPGERTRLIGNGILNVGGFVFSKATDIVLIPVLLHGLGAELYGLWIASFSVSALVGWADLGLGWSLTREIAKAEAGIRGDGF